MIERCRSDYPVGMMCRCLDVSTSGFYAWAGRKPGPRISAVIAARDKDIVHVQQKPASRAACHLGQKRGLGDRGLGKAQIAGRVLQQHAPPQHRLHRIDMVTDQGQCLVRIGQWQQIVQILCPVARPGQMFGKAGRVQPANQCLQPIQMLAVQGTFAADRQADPVDRDHHRRDHRRRRDHRPPAEPEGVKRKRELNKRVAGARLCPC